MNQYNIFRHHTHKREDMIYWDRNKKFQNAHTSWILKISRKAVNP